MKYLRLVVSLVCCTLISVHGSPLVAIETKKQNETLPDSRKNPSISQVNSKEGDAHNAKLNKLSNDLNEDISGKSYAQSEMVEQRDDTLSIDQETGGKESLSGFDTHQMSLQKPNSKELVSGDTKLNITSDKKKDVGDIKKTTVLSEAIRGTGSNRESEMNLGIVNKSSVPAKSVVDVPESPLKEPKVADNNDNVSVLPPPPKQSTPGLGDKPGLQESSNTKDEKDFSVQLPDDNKTSKLTDTKLDSMGDDIYLGENVGDKKANQLSDFNKDQLDFDSDQTDKERERQQPYPVTHGEMSDDRSSHFFAYLLTLMVMVIFLYLLFHNKQRILALIIEGRTEKNRRRNTRAKYHKLDNNLEEAMTSTKGSNTSLNRVY